MSVVPSEFDPAFIAEHSAPEQQMYRAENASTEPMKSVLENNPEIHFVEPRRGADWGNWEYVKGAYYDTTTGPKHEYWRDVDLPVETKDTDRLRHDFVTWGYCKVDAALSPAQVAVVRERVLDQAEGERRAKIAQKTPSGQNINACVNKGECFEGLIQQDPSIMQGGPLVEQLVTEALGAGWICTSLIGAIDEFIQCLHASRLLPGSPAGMIQLLFARLAFACSAIAPKPSGSCTAISASTLRSTSMLARFKPLISRL